MVLATLLDNKNYLLTLAELDGSLRLNTTKRRFDQRQRIEITPTRFADILLEIMSYVDLRVAQRKDFYNRGFSSKSSYDTRSLALHRVLNLSKEDHEVIIKNFNLFKDKIIEERKEEYGL